MAEFALDVFVLTDSLDSTECANIDGKDGNVGNAGNEYIELDAVNWFEGKTFEFLSAWFCLFSLFIVI